MAKDAVRSRRSSALKKKIVDAGSSTRSTRRIRKRRDIERERQARTGLVVVIAVIVILLLLSLAFGGRASAGGDVGLQDKQRFQRAKDLRDAVLNKGGKFVGRLRGGGKKSSHSGAKDMTATRGGKNGGMRYLDPRQLPPLPGAPRESYKGKGDKHGFDGTGDDGWEESANKSPRKALGPLVDYTKNDRYTYPDLMYEPPNDGTYPPFESMLKVFETWGQDDLDSPPDTIAEVLQHFDYKDPEQVEAAIRYRDLELPFKMYNVREVIGAGRKWTDEYLSEHFNGENDDDDAPESHGQCQQSVDNFFAFHRAEKWSVPLLGPPPSVDLDWTFDRWARHAVYADEVSLPIGEKHVYWQSGVPREERMERYERWTFVSRDLPSFSSPEPTFFGFNPREQKGIQCRFGERGITAATHYDGGRNMIAMITGAKRYILSPPNACTKLGVVTERKHPSYRHSMLNFGRVTLLDKTSDINMSEREREWLRIAADAPTLSTVLKAGEVLYVPSHWFHYIVSLQKSAQCNTRSGMHEEGNPYWGGEEDVVQCTAGDSENEEEGD